MSFLDMDPGLMVPSRSLASRGPNLCRSSEPCWNIGRWVYSFKAAWVWYCVKLSFGHIWMLMISWFSVSLQFRSARFIEGMWCESGCCYFSFIVLSQCFFDDSLDSSLNVNTSVIFRGFTTSMWSVSRSTDESGGECEKMKPHRSVSKNQFRTSDTNETELIQMNASLKLYDKYDWRFNTVFMRSVTSFIRSVMKNQSRRWWSLWHTERQSTVQTLVKSWL